MIKSTLRTRIFASFIGLLVLIQAITVYTIYQATRDELIASIESQLQAGKSVFLNQFKSRTQYLQSNVSIASKDWGFREAVAQNDVATIKSALISQKKRITSDITLVTDIEGKVLTFTGSSKDEAPQFLNFLKDAPAKTFSRIGNIEGVHYQLVFSPIKAPTHIGWITAGFVIDNAMAHGIKKMINLDISFIQSGGNENSIIGTTLGENDAKQLESPLLHRVFKSHEPQLVKKPKPALMLYISQISKEKEMSVVLQQSLDTPLDNFKKSWSELFLLLAISVSITTIIAYFIAKSITGPIRKLLQAVSQISLGDYENRINIDRQDEIGLLAKDFSKMQDAIQERELEIRYRADYDALTKLFNRDYFLRKTEELIAAEESQGKQFAIAVFDLNEFKEINDTLGHYIGDQLLVRIAELLSKAFEDAEILARLGGDEFGVVKEVKNGDGIQQLGQRINAIFDSPFNQSDIAISLSAGLGISLFPQHGESSITLLRFADIAMYKSKSEGVQTAIYDSEYDIHSVQRLALMSEMGTAINEGQLTLYYQPKLTLNKENPKLSEVTHVECLVRWIHPTHGFIPPDDFIPMAEQTGNVCLLTAWVINEALRQCKEWRDAGIELKMAVNISAKDLHTGRLIDDVNATLEKHSLPAEFLILEVTESAVMSNIDKSVSQLKYLKESGVKSSIDDFGTGYSSMEQLKTLPADELKIDKSFVQKLNSDEQDALIVRTSIELAHGMGLYVVAEGVENEESLHILASLGCDMAQGYFIARPMPSHDLYEWLNSCPYKMPHQKLKLAN